MGMAPGPVLPVFDFPGGFADDRLMVGTAIFFAVGVVANIIQMLFFRKETVNITLRDSGYLGTIMVWTATICMWLFWMFTFMHQMNPLISPVKANKDAL